MMALIFTELIFTVPSDFPDFPNRRKGASKNSRSWLAGLVFFCLGLLGPLYPAQGDIIRIGSGANCNALSITHALQQALVTPGPDEIRLEKEFSYNESIVIDNATVQGPVTLSGGWESCTSSSSTGRSFILRTSPPAVVTVTNNQVVVLDGIELFGLGQISLDVSSGSQVTLINSHVGSGSTGIRVSLGAEVTLERDSLVIFNETTSPDEGGGITCGLPGTPNSGGTVNINGQVFSNSAPNGGGIHGRWPNCRIIVGEGAVIRDNEATFGGGVFLAQGAFMGGGGTGSQGSRIHSNNAEQGGGLYVTDPGTRATLFNTRIENNEAMFTGGGVEVRKDGFFSLNRSPVNDCPNPPRCSVISRNQLTFPGDNEGSALYVRNGGQAELFRVFIEENSGFNRAGQAIHVEDDNTTILLHSVQIWNNRTQAAMSATGSAALSGAYVSVARNNWLVAGESFLPSFGASASGGADVTLVTSILTDTRGYSGDVVGDCLIVDDDNNLTAFNTLVGVDPGFQDPASGDLHLRSTSPALDYCDDSYPPIGSDIDLQSRGNDNPLEPNLLGPYDLGADENTDSPLIFADGFESGNTSSWPVTAP
ncbi:MAG: hypothetical protein K0U98_03740 [Deltaproteobacteria bacterium]|nr:hypothetical protein [Deltaproteobacteria bacterium]